MTSSVAIPCCTAIAAIACRSRTSSPVRQPPSAPNPNARPANSLELTKSRRTLQRASANKAWKPKGRSGQQGPGQIAAPDAGGVAHCGIQPCSDWTDNNRTMKRSKRERLFVTSLPPKNGRDWTASGGGCWRRCTRPAPSQVLRSTAQHGAGAGAEQGAARRGMAGGRAGYGAARRSTAQHGSGPGGVWRSTGQHGSAALGKSAAGRSTAVHRPRQSARELIPLGGGGGRPAAVLPDLKLAVLRIFLHYCRQCSCVGAII